MIATEKKSTGSISGRHIQGVLFLTAGYGTRAEPLSFCRPKALLPWKNTTLLGNLVRQFSVLDLEKMAFNASRCPELVIQEAALEWKGAAELLFEHRPLGLSGTLSRNRKMFEGHWIISNTDMVIDVPVEDMVHFHRTSGSKWTVLTGNFPEYGKYGALSVNGKHRHYLGVSIISPEVAVLAEKNQLATGYFTELRKIAETEGIHVQEYFTGARWLDMGEKSLFRKHILEDGSYIHPSACIDDDVTMEGFYRVGSSCIIRRGSSIRDSVMLEGSELLPGASLCDDVLPWFSKRS